jgi:hypothetical protein
MVSRPLRARIDDRFFSGMLIFIFGTVFLGFAHSYFLAGLIHTTQPSPIIHIHAVVFSAWVLLLIAQTTMVSIGKIGWHMKLGILGAGLACLVVILGVMAIADSTRRHFTPPGLDAGTFLAVDLAEMAIFGLLISWGLRVRRDGPAHKRLVMLATSVMMFAPVGRWPFAFITSFPLSIPLIVSAFPASIILFDLLTLRRVHRVTVCGFFLIFFMFPVMFALGHSTFWQHFTGWVQR